MKAFSVSIANYSVRFECESEKPVLNPGKRFSRFLSSSRLPDIIIKVTPGKYMLPATSVKVFDAPYVEEINGSRMKKSDNFWSIHKHDQDLFIKTSLPFSNSGGDAILRFSLSDRNWQLWIDRPGEEADPLEYPLDGLILYYLSAIKGDILIHASGVSIAEKGFLFSGISGKGKSTMARLWKEAGAKVINDDRLIIGNTKQGFRIFNTPVYDYEEPAEAPVNKIFLISHGSVNVMKQLSGARAVSSLMSNCIQHSWNKDLIEKLMDSASDVCRSVPVYDLAFRPDNSVIEEILNND
ncbi:MAG: hypothetical protein JXR66_08275 [Bacteroidales bacterium]|nr:hypothetical protein [Bacteroidales bacterium]